MRRRNGGDDAGRQEVEEPLLLDRDQAGALLGVCGETFARRVKLGLAPAPVWGLTGSRRGDRPRWSRPELEAWVRAGCPEADAWEREKRRGRAGLAS